MTSKTIPTMQFQISIDIGRINLIISIIRDFSPPAFGRVIKLFFDDFFTLLLVTPLVCNTASKLNHWNSL